MPTQPEHLLIGAHTSTQGGIPNALREGKEIGATTIQFFTSNQKRWDGRSLTDQDIQLWEETLREIGMTQMMSHDSYLINLGSPDPEILRKSRKAFKEELARCQKLGLTFLNFHPGAATSSSEEACLETIVTSLLELERECAEGPTRLLIEATAGQGSAVGHRFEHLGYLVQRVQDKIPIGVCIDTCHIFAAGYDIRTQEGWEHTLQEFDRHVGLKHLYGLHLNDSLKPLGSRRDRHANLGEGEIGIEAFKFVMQHPLLRELPKYLETPDGPTRWKEEIKLLREFAT
jgi:deoxyribonuclease-4